MLNENLIETYSKMSDAEKIAELKRIIKFGDMPPLHMLFALLIVLDPDKVKEIFIRLRE